MKILVATDAWRPQVNGVVRTLGALAKSAGRLGATIEFLSPDGFRTFPLPTYRTLRLAVTNPREIARRIEAAAPDAIHIATEGTIGHAVRRYCVTRGLPFTTSYTTRFPEYVAARFRLPESLGYAFLRRFHNASATTMVATRSMRDELERQGFSNLGMWSRGVDVGLFRPVQAPGIDLPRPIFVTVGRVAVEKNLDAFLSLDLPGSKVVIGDGPQLDDLRARYPDVHFLGLLEQEALVAQLSNADVFVFPSRTDTFGLVQLEALACGTPVAAFPVTGPLDVIGDAPVGALSEDLRAACLAALDLPREGCRAFAEARSWETTARQFLEMVKPLRA